jgi:hypothetical protein
MRSAAALLCVLLIGSACGGSDSTEVEALEERIAELEEEKDVSQTSSKVTSSASKSSTSKSQPKASSSGLSIAEAKYLAEIMSEVTGTVDLFGAQVTRTQVQCFMEKLIAGRGIAGSERLNDSLASMGDYGGLPRSDASFFFGAVGACVDLLKAQKESARAETPELDVECAFKGVTKKDVEDWFIDFYVEGVQAFQEKVWDRVYYRIPDCLR